MPIIGQQIVIEDLLNKPLHHCNLIQGPKGSGKRTILQYVAQKLKYEFVELGGGVADARGLIEKCVCVSKPTIYYMVGDTATIQAQNALLKLMEEPPQNAYIFVGVTDSYNVLGTIRSRSHAIYLAAYDFVQLKRYCNIKQVDEHLIKTICEVVDTPGAINRVLELNFTELYEYVTKVYNNILTVTTGNAFKICNSIGFKDEKDKYPVDLFLEIFRSVAADHMSEDYYRGAALIEYTSIALADLRVRGANKPLIFDIWVLNVRKLR